MKSYTLGRAIAGLLLVISSNTLADRPDSHAPIGVMADHGHKKGEWMLSYRTMRMAMDTLIEGSGESLASAELLPEGGYRVMPEDMTMTMHMTATPARSRSLRARVSWEATCGGG